MRELSERVQLAQSPLSQHLSKLRALRLVATRRDGQMIVPSCLGRCSQHPLTTLLRINCVPQETRADAQHQSP